MKLVSAADQLISHVVSPAKEVEEAPAEGAVATAAEPEVVKKGKKEEEGKEAEKSDKKPEKKK